MDAQFNMKQWGLATLAVFAIITAVTFVMMRLAVQPWVMPVLQDEITTTDRIGTYLSRLILSGLFTYIFTKTTYADKSSMGHGLRFGFGMGLLMFVPNFIAGVAHSELSTSAQAVYMVTGLIQSVVCGVAMAQLYKPGKTADK